MQGIEPVTSSFIRLGKCLSFYHLSLPFILRWSFCWELFCVKSQDQLFSFWRYKFHKSNFWYQNESNNKNKKLQKNLDGRRQHTYVRMYVYMAKKILSLLLVNTTHTEIVLLHSRKTNLLSVSNLKWKEEKRSQVFPPLLSGLLFNFHLILFPPVCLSVCLSVCLFASCKKE